MRRATMVVFAAALSACAGSDASDDGVGTTGDEASTSSVPMTDSGDSTGAAQTESSGDDGSSGSTTGSEPEDGSSSGGEPAEPWADCDDETMCGGTDVCAVDPLPGEGPGLQWCGSPCDPDGPGDECPEPPAGSEVTEYCFDLHDGTGMCALDCAGGLSCPFEMTCFNGNLCLYGED